MLSNPNINLHQRQRQHRRQNSTPTVFDAPKVPLLPAKAIQRPRSHQRGLSLDQRSPQRRQGRLTQQDDESVSTNPGLQQYQQHTLREAQQQRLARPGPQENERQPHREYQIYEGHPDIHEKEKLNEGFETSIEPNNDALFFDPQSHPTTLIPDVAAGQQTGNNRHRTEDTLLYSGLSIKEIDDFLTLANGYAGHDRARQDESWRLRNETPSVSLDPTKQERRGSLQPKVHSQQQRPITPHNQNAFDGFPLTPATTPFKSTAQTDAVHQVVRLPPKLRDDDATIRASPPRAMQRGKSCMEFFNECRLHLDSDDLPSPPHTAPLVASDTFDLAPMPNPNFMNMSSLKLEYSGSENGYESSYYSPMSSAHSPTMSSLRSSPGISHVPVLDTMVEEMPNTEMDMEPALSSSRSAMSLTTATSPVRDSFLPRAMSISDLNLDASIEDTGITVDEIASFISGPDPTDGKWVCLFPECNGRFGRKENIKSHVQTHLGDRQYRCNHCKKCFVRQHDLKRHAKIHSGVKPYPCLCGNSFARHDALTRHRQRGNCIGAFDGIVKKVAKRGRPKKTRPETEERLEKAARTRKRAIAKSYASSTSGSSECSYPQSPRPEFDGLANQASSPFTSFPPPQNNDCGYSPELFVNTPPTSPRKPEICVSPMNTQFSSSQNDLGTNTPVKRASITSTLETLVLPANPPTSSKDSSSQYSTPPELCIESSSPVASRFFDFDGDVHTETNEGGVNDEHGKVEVSELRLPEMNEQVDQMFLDTFTSDAGISLLERDPDMLLLEKLDDEFFSDNYLGSAEDFLDAP